MDASARIVHGLGRVVDDHLAWLSSWHHAAFYAGAERSVRASALKNPDSFLQWVERARQTIPQQAALLDRLSFLFDQLHTAARMVLLRAPEDAALAQSDYEMILARFDEFVSAIRRMERAYSDAEAGLDPLTGLRTRHGLEDDFNREFNRFKNAGTPFVMTVLDLDHFKQVNDTYGHDTGDKVLVAVTNTVLRSIRTYDDAYRLGGGTFLIIMKGLDETSADSVLERLRSAVSRTTIKIPDGGAIKPTASFGFCLVQQNVTFEAVMKHAEQAVYQAGRDGGNRVVKA